MLPEVKQSVVSWKQLVVFLWQQLFVFINQETLSEMKQHSVDHISLWIEIFHNRFTQEKESINILFNQGEPKLQIKK